MQSNLTMPKSQNNSQLETSTQNGKRKFSQTAHDHSQKSKLPRNDYNIQNISHTPTITQITPDTDSNDDQQLLNISISYDASKSNTPVEIDTTFTPDSTGLPILPDNTNLTSSPILPDNTNSTGTQIKH